MKKIIFILLLPLYTICQNSYNLGLVGSYEWNSTEGSDIWGWVDPINENEYALVGLNSGFSCVNVSNPSNPVEEFYISDLNSTWRDIKTWGNYAYVTTEADAGLLIVDLTDMTGNTYWHVTQFSNPNTGQSTSFTAAHNLYIDENGVCYIFGASSNHGNNPADGVIFLDVSTNATNPIYLGEWNEEYIHDGMARGDTLYAGCIYAGELYIIDVSNKSNPQTLGTHPTPSNFTHNAWISDDGSHVFTTDETSDAYIGSYNINSMSNIQEVDRIQSNPGSNSVPHNTHVDGNFIVTSWYRDGTTVHDITYPNNLIQVAYYDSYAGAGNGFDGCWGTYPFFPSGIIISSEINSSSNQSGKLMIYERGFSQACYLEGNVTDASTGNPINGANIEILNTTIPNSSSSNLIGDYMSGTADAATYSIVFSKPGYLSDTISATLNNGIVTIVDAALQPLVSFNINGIVLDPVGNGIENAQVIIFNDDFSFTYTTDINGIFTVNNIFEGNYEIIVGIWGYITSCNNEYINPSSNLSITLQEGYYDDFTFDFGWSVSGGITSVNDGKWERGQPEGTNDNGTNYNPNEDINGDCKNYAYVTGLSAGSQTGSHDVDDFNTILTSPIFDLSTQQKYYLNYYSWFQNGFPWGGNSNDSLTISISNGSNTVLLERYTANSPDLGQWNLRSFDLEQYISPITSTMQLIIETADWDALGGDWVEGGFDGFEITNTITSIENEKTNNKSKIIKIIDILGKNVKNQNNQILFYIYEDGSVKKYYTIE